MASSLRHPRRPSLSRVLPVARVATSSRSPVVGLLFPSILPILVIATLLVGCSRPSGSQSEPDEAVAPASAGAAQDDAAVEYQPAFPEEVSEAPLEEADVEQQEAAHSHGEGAHSHGEDTHTHDDDSDHEHGDGDHAH